MHDESTRMKLERDATLTRLTEKLGKLDDYVSDKVQTVTDSVQSARDSLDLKLQVRRRPWALVAGAVALGLLGGYRSRLKERRETMRNSVAIAVPQTVASAPAAKRRQPVLDKKGAAAARPPTDAAAIRWAKNMSNSFNPELKQLKTFAVGLVAGLARDELLKHSRPEKSSAGSHGNNGR